MLYVDAVQWNGNGKRKKGRYLQTVTSKRDTRLALQRKSRQTLVDLSTESWPRETAENSQASESLQTPTDMTGQSDHLTSGRRRKHKSPASIPPVHDLPLPRQLNHMGAEDGPSCSEEEKDAKRQRPASTTPRSTMGTLPYEYDGVMGVASMGSHESVRFGEENDPEIEDVQDTVAHNREELNQTHEERNRQHDETPGVGGFHGDFFGSASLKKCLDGVAQSTTTPSATCHSGEGMGEHSSRMTSPPQKNFGFPCTEPDSTWHLFRESFCESGEGVRLPREKG